MPEVQSLGLFRAQFTPMSTKPPVSVEYKLDVYSDFYKDTFGYRPRWAVTDEQRIQAYDAAAAHLDKLKSTEEGRAILRADGWRV